MIKVFIGFDSVETVAYNVLQHSIHRRASVPVAVTPLRLSQLQGIFTREWDPKQSTEFSFSRFLTPYLSNYEGWSVFMDCDMIMLADIAELWEQRDDRYAVQVVKHDHNPTETVKFLDRPQSPYQKKNWSSVMLFNNAKCKALTPDFVNTASGLELHQFKWLESDDLIGELPSAWNHLVDVSPKRPDAKLVHYTIGGPYFEEYKNCEYAKEWFEERDSMLYCMTREEIRRKKEAALASSPA